MKLSEQERNAIRVRHWLKQTSDMIDDPDMKFARKTITEIRERIQRSGLVTDAMIQALKNIRHGRRD